MGLPGCIQILEPGNLNPTNQDRTDSVLFLTTWTARSFFLVLGDGRLIRTQDRKPKASVRAVYEPTHGHHADAYMDPSLLLVSNEVAPREKFVPSSRAWSVMITHTGLHLLKCQQVCSSRSQLEIVAGRFRCWCLSADSSLWHDAMLSSQCQDSIMRFGGSTSPKMPWPVT